MPENFIACLNRMDLLYLAKHCRSAKKKTRGFRRGARRIFRRAIHPAGAGGASLPGLCRAHQRGAAGDGEYFKGKPQLTNLHIEITSKCNERCVHCYIPHDAKVSSIEPDLFYDVLNQCKNMRLLHLTLSGGEPMLHKNFCDFLRKCKEYDFSVNVLSNLTLLDDEIIKEMKMNPLLGVQVSLYSMDSNIHDEITQMKGSFEKTKNEIRVKKAVR